MKLVMGDLRGSAGLGDMSLLGPSCGDLSPPEVLVGWT